MVGGQAPKAIRSVECYDFQEDRWYQVADLPSRRCRAGMSSFTVPVLNVYCSQLSGRPNPVFVCVCVVQGWCLWLVRFMQWEALMDLCV